MGRRSFISITTIKRLASHSSRIKKENIRINLINQQINTEKEKQPVYELKSVEFNLNTRIAKLLFIETKEYKTIERYVTQNYVKYPIYSDWKSKTKNIQKTIKLTNSELELLNSNSDPLIKSFAEDIIIALNNEELFPSWFLREYLKKELVDKIAKLEEENKNFKSVQMVQIKNCNDSILESTKIKKDLISKQNLLIKKLTKKQTVISKINNAKPTILKFVFSLGIYNYLISKNRKSKILQKIELLNNSISECCHNIDIYSEKIKKLENTINDYNQKIKNKNNQINSKQELEMIEYNKKISEITPLMNTLKENIGFVKLKLLNGLAYEKIIGCYIIHNIEKDKYYVGQSKDVFKRLNQHFKGTVPHNPIFAEDYYTSAFANKEDLFEIKIIKCSTKDELDSTEKYWIEYYDSWNNGYNGTSGNT